MGSRKRKEENFTRKMLREGKKGQFVQALWLKYIH